ncbi:MAG: hypothetical protein U0T79_09480 [Ferruginibacter sp.]
MNSKIVNALIILFSVFLFFLQLFAFVKHIDYFATRTLTSAGIVGLIENKKGPDSITVVFLNSYSKENQIAHISISFDLSNDLKKKETVEIYYTKFFDQVLIKGFKNPRLLILFLDILMLFVFYLGVKAGLNSFKKVKMTSSQKSDPF